MWGIMLLWLFFGVAVISDAFVEGIEVITDTTHQVQRMDQHGRPFWREEPVWNWAVANITLLAVGSSSPEILLSLIETLLTLGRPAGEIGASCIVGSVGSPVYKLS
jgi:Ca2+/Na+ antiporter